MRDSWAPAARPASARGRSGAGMPGRSGAGMPGRSGARIAPSGVWGRTSYVLSCIVAALVLLASGLSYVLVRDVSSIGGSHAIASGPSTGPQDILPLGLGGRPARTANTRPPGTPATRPARQPPPAAHGTA